MQIGILSMLHTPHIIPFHQFFARSFFFVSVVVSCCCYFFSSDLLFIPLLLHLCFSVDFFPIHTFVWCGMHACCLFCRCSHLEQQEIYKQWILGNIIYVLSRRQSKWKKKKKNKNETINKTGKQYQPTYYLDSGSFLLQRSWVFRLVYLFCCCCCRRCCCCLLTWFNREFRTPFVRTHYIIPY